MPYIDYTDHGDGSFSFHDDMGGTTPPMAGPAAQQQKNKIDLSSPPLIPPTRGIRGERAELSPELLEAGAPGEDARTAAFTVAPNGSVLDAGGAPAGGSPDMGRLIDAGMSAGEAQAYVKQKENERASLDWIAGKGRAVKEALGLTKEAGTEDVNKKRAEAGLPPAAVNQPAAPPGKDGGSEFVAESDRVQLARPEQGGLRLAPPAGGSAPQLKEVKAGETYAYQDIPDEKKQAVKEGYQAQYNAAGQLGEAQQKSAANIAGELAQIPTGLTNLEIERQRREDSIAQRVQEDHEELSRLREESRQEIDPRRVFKNQSAAEKFMGALALGIGAYVQTMTGGQNNAMNILNQSIRDDIDSQKENRNAAHERIKDKRGEMAERRIKFSDERQDFMARKAQYLEFANSKLNTYMQDAKTDEQKAVIADMQAKVQTEAAKLDAEFGRVSHQVQTKVIQTGGVGGPGVRNDVDPELYVEEAGGFALRKDVPKEINDRFAGLNKMARLTKRIKAVGARVDQRADPASRAELDSLTSQLLVAYKEAEKMGTLDKGTQEVGTSVMGDPKSLLGIGRERVLDGLLNGIESDKRNLQRTHGITPGKVEVVSDGKGGLKRVGIYTGQHGDPGSARQQYDFKPAGAK